MSNDLNVSGRLIKAVPLMAHYVKTAGPRQVAMGDIDDDGDLDLLAVADKEQIYLIINNVVDKVI